MWWSISTLINRLRGRQHTPAAGVRLQGLGFLVSWSDVVPDIGGMLTMRGHFEDYMIVLQQVGRISVPLSLSALF